MTALRFILIVVCIRCLFLFTACGQPGNDAKSTDAAIPFSGCWLSENYYNSIQTLRSPRAAQDESHFVVIPERTSNVTSWVHNFHEAVGVQFVKNGDRYEAWNEYLTKQHQLEILSENKIKLGGDTYVKINCTPSNPTSGILQEILFRGIYTNGNGDTVELKNNGELTGLGKYVTYEPRMDYYDAALNIDLVDLLDTANTPETFAFKFNQDTLDLYHIQCVTKDENGNCMVIDHEELAFRLMRQ